MIQLASFLWGMVLLFGVMGFVRGSAKEMIALSGIVLGLFILEQLRDILLSPLLATASLDQQFYLYAGLLLTVTLFAYQTPERFDKTQRSSDAREGLQEGLLGTAIGGLNAYLLFGSLWYYMDNLGYPLSPNIMAPPLDSASAELVNQLPLVWLLEGNLLTLLVVIMFLFVIIVLI
jgi:hypothetical protein